MKTNRWYWVAALWLTILGSARVQAQFSYTTNQDLTIAITGYTRSAQQVTIPSEINGHTVTVIGDYAFQFSSLTNITLPNSVTSIGDYAFSSCSGLNNITIPNSVTSIGDYAFSSCSGLNNITIPNSVTSIGDYAFSSCSGLTNITIPSSVTSIGDYAFYNCDGLTSITIPNSVTSIGIVAFCRCTRLTGVTIGNSLATIENYAFVGCPNLSQALFEGSRPTLGDGAFAGSPVTLYYLPGTQGWDSVGYPTAVWNRPDPVILRDSSRFAGQPAAYQFTVSWATNQNVVIEAATDLDHPLWQPLSTNALNAGVVQFVDPDATPHPTRLYRARPE